MDVEELKNYLKENSNVENLFTSKCLDYLTEKNENLPKAKRWPQEKLDREADKMYSQFLQGIRDKISTRFKGYAKHDPDKWRHFMEVNEVPDELEESVVDIEFE